VPDHVFADESKQRGLLLAAAYVTSNDVCDLRTKVNGMRMAGQRRMHMRHESDERRKRIMKLLTDAGVRALVYDATHWRDAAKARRLTIGQLVDDALAARAERLVLEQDDSLMASDNEVIRQQLRKAGTDQRLRYAHHRAHEEPLLSVPDAIAWCWAKGGKWRRLAEPLVVEVRTVLGPGAAWA